VTLDVCEFIVSESKPVIGLSSVFVCETLFTTVGRWHLLIYKFHMEVCNSCSKCPV